MSTNKTTGKLQSLRVRLALFYAALITVALLLFGAAVYAAAVISEAEENEPQADKEMELDAIRRRLFMALGAGIPAGVSLAAAGSSWMTRRTLRALGDIVRTANSVGPERLHQRLPIHAQDDVEIQRLAHALNQMLDRVDRAVTGLRRFTADAAHELRTPLSALLSGLEICLRKPRDPAELRAVMEDTLEGLGRLTRLVDVLLTLARSDAGALPIARTPVNIQSLLAEVANPYEGLAVELGLTLKLHLQAEAIWWPTDGLLLSRAVANLIDNACKFTPHGGVVEVRAHASQYCIAIAVNDTGPGLSEQDQERIFERFYRGAAHRGHIEGFGVGLALAREIVTALGGTLRLRNRPTGGTEALISLTALPHARSDSAEPDARPASV